MKQKFRIIMPDGRISYTVAENSATVRARLAKQAGPENARMASVTAFADVPPATAVTKVKRG